MDDSIARVDVGLDDLRVVDHPGSVALSDGGSKALQRFRAFHLDHIGGVDATADDVSGKNPFELIESHGLSGGISHLVFEEAKQ